MMRLPSSRRSVARAAATMLIAGLVLTGCSGQPSAAPATGDTSASAADLLAAHDLAGLDAAQVIERLDTMPVADRPTDLIASVRPDALVISTADGQETSLPMPDDEVYLSIAQYREQTHGCHFHSLTTCLGELSDADVQITLVDADGSVIVDEATTTYDNGFIGVWVPRGIQGTLTISHDGGTGTVEISTVRTDDPTCITTLQLS